MYWYVMGTLLTAERPGMSQRVKRRLAAELFGPDVFLVAESGAGERLHVRRRQCDAHGVRFACWA